MNFLIKEDFFIQNPMFSVAFSSVPSNVMWAITLDQHPKSIYRNLDAQTRRSLIETEYLKSSLDWEALKDTIELFKELSLSKRQRFLNNWENKLEERDNFIASLPYDESTYEILDKIMAQSDKMWKQWSTCLKDVQEEETLQTTEGGALESLSEQNLI